MKTPSEELRCSRHVHCRKTRSRTLGQATWLALLLSSLFLKTVQADPNVVAWGSNQYGQTNVPPNLTNAVMVAGGGAHSLALRTDGTVVAWGAGLVDMNNWPDCGQSMVPPGLMNVVAVAAGDTFSLALKSDGTVVAWGRYYYWGSPIILADGLTNVVAITAGRFHSLALKADGTVVAWGYYWENGRTYPLGVPRGLTKVLAVACGSAHSLALVGAGPPVLPARMVDRQTFKGGTVYWQCAASGEWPLSYQWQVDGRNLVGATNRVLALTNVDSTNAGAYSVIVSNALGSTSSPPALLTLVPALLNTQPQDQGTYLGGFATFSVEAQAAGPLTCQWRFNGTPLAGATNSSLALSNLQLNQTGAYSVEVSTDAGIVTSREARLDVGVVRVCGGGRSASDLNYLNRLTNVVAVATGCCASIALKDDGTVVASWVDDGAPPPTTSVFSGLTNIVDISAGGPFFDCGMMFLALKDDGTVITSEGVIAGLSIIVAVDGGLALQADGMVVEIGWDGDFAVVAGLTNVVAIASGPGHHLALKADGTVVAWGTYWNGTTNVPATVPAGLTNVVAIACGASHSLALTADGQVVDWGCFLVGSSVLPAVTPPGLTNVVAVAGGEAHGLALRADGTVVAWGHYYNEDGTYVPATVPDDLGVVSSLTRVRYYWLAILGSGPPVLSASLSNARRGADGFSVSVPTQSGRVYALEYKNALADAVWTALPLVAGTGHERTLIDPTATGAQRFYRVRRW